MKRKPTKRKSIKKVSKVKKKVSKKRKNPEISIYWLVVDEPEYTDITLREKAQNNYMVTRYYKYDQNHIRQLNGLLKLLNVQSVKEMISLNGETIKIPKENWNRIQYDSSLDDSLDRKYKILSRDVY